jgi:hypothetical protein
MNIPDNYVLKGQYNDVLYEDVYPNPKFIYPTRCVGLGYIMPSALA